MFRISNWNKRFARFFSRLRLFVELRFFAVKHGGPKFIAAIKKTHRLRYLRNVYRCFIDKIFANLRFHLEKTEFFWAVENKGLSHKIWISETYSNIFHLFIWKYWAFWIKTDTHSLIWPQVDQLNKTLDADIRFTFTIYTAIMMTHSVFQTT